VTHRGHLTRLQAEPGRGDELAALLHRLHEQASADGTVVSWYAFRVDAELFGIFDTFESEDENAYAVDGPVFAAVTAAGPDLLAVLPRIHVVDVIASIQAADALR
jgi:quinol monooxygenase YgiN